MTIEQIKQHITNYAKSHNWTDTSDDGLAEVLMGEKEIWRGDEDKHRWWTNYTAVVEIDGKLIGFQAAETHGDSSAQDVGWEFDWANVSEMEPVEVKKITYRAKPRD